MLYEDTRSGGDEIGGEVKEDIPRSCGEGAWEAGDMNEFEVFIIGENDSALPRGGEVGFDLNDPNDFCLLTSVGGPCGKAEGIGGGLSFSFDTFLPVILDMNDLNDFADLGGSSLTGDGEARVSAGGSVELKKSANSCASDRPLGFDVPCAVDVDRTDPCWGTVFTERSFLFVLRPKESSLSRVVAGS